MVLFIDNYDSFSYILIDYLKQCGLICLVIRNDEAGINDILKMDFNAVVISPGPGRPENTGIVNPVIEEYYQKIPILGICLGYQALGNYFGGHLLNSPEPVHGKTETIRHNNHPLFQGIPEYFEAMRYHSLIIKIQDPGPLKPISFTSEKLVMGFAHETRPIIGLQFHPESILTHHGLQIIRNWKQINNL